MATPNDKSGPLTADELEAIWSASVDRSYREPLQTAGDGGGMEVYRQGFEQLARVSLAIDRSFQAMYVLPFSGQTQDPASGPEKATVVLTFTRTGYLNFPIVLRAGLIWVDEDNTDSDTDGGTPVDTGRRYQLDSDVVFFPGEQGPFTTTATAACSGWGYNEPLPGTITLLEQPGSRFQNDLATVKVTGAPLTTLVAQNVPDMFVPEHLGQYVVFTNGANVGKTARMVSFVAPDASTDTGSAVVLEQLALLVTNSMVGAFVPGETVVFSGATTGTGTVIASRGGDGYGLGRLAVAIQAGTVAIGTVFTGSSSTAQATAQIMLSDGTFASEAPSGVPEVGGAAWLVLDWNRDLGVSVTNTASPDGGRLGMLDLLGNERGLKRAPTEIDDDYRERIAIIADVVSPNAIRRVLNRALGSLPWCFREVGSSLLPGIFYDRAGDSSGDFYDDGSLGFVGFYLPSASFLHQEPVQYLRGSAVLAQGYWGSYLKPVSTAMPAGQYPQSVVVPTPTPIPGAGFTLVVTRDKFLDPFPSITWQSGDVIVGMITGAQFACMGALASTRPNDKVYATYLDYTEMRACFIVGVPPLGFGEFGFAYDLGAYDAYDAAPWDAFYDGFPAQDSQFYGRAWAGVESVRAGGVTWSLVQTSGSCK